MGEEDIAWKLTALYYLTLQPFLKCSMQLKFNLRNSEKHVKLEKSHTFAVYPWTERQLFSLQLREKGDTFKTFELKDDIDASGVELLSCGLNGI